MGTNQCKGAENLPLDFQVPDRSSADAARNAALFRDKTLSPSDPIHKAIDPVNQKRQLFPALRSDSPGWFLSYDYVTETATTPTAEFRNEYRIPFRLTPTGPIKMREKLHAQGRWPTCLGAAFAYGLGSTHPCTSAVHMEPFSTSVLEDLTQVFATTTKICARGGSR